MKTPQELLEHVANIIQQKQEKKMRCFYSVKIFKNGATTELIERKAASPDFLQDVQQIISTNKPDTVIIELYKGSSYKVKTAEAEFYIDLIGREIAFPQKVESFSGFDHSTFLNEIRRNYDQQMQGVRDVANLHTTLTISQIELKHAQEKIKELESDLKEAEDYIEQVENDLRSRPQLNGPGGLNLVNLGSYWLEGILRRNPGIVAGTLGISDEQAKGLFTETKSQQTPSLPNGSTTGTIKEESDDKQITEREQMRIKMIEQVAGFLRQLPDVQLQLSYDLLMAISKDLSLLETLTQLLPAKNTGK